ncbi:class I poly(R)-hydroxyalkanoic acid synthase [Novosphingobium flavum]|uniref:Class I poly(R)-hydroxyalkanoic acid synthase n=1 Tax=Novosphingobium flavum TaxID=1778672 RepID=A0A7X1FNZ1_9SPHN|nr:class I poly(R)-hydroxyalkanoic acid synthase [Novosphingobium flavum]MBC2664315.1 class I poly(R)-hydroxyalkanoic acid synthase [Novosphingobium flavum]
MADQPTTTGLSATEIFEEMVKLQSRVSEMIVGQLGDLAPAALPTQDDLVRQWADCATEFTNAWHAAGSHDSTAPAAALTDAMTDPEQWRQLVDAWYTNLPLADAQTQKSLLNDSMKLWDGVLAQFGIGTEKAPGHAVELPRKDRRFADPRWKEQPLFAVMHQSYLLLAEQVGALADRVEGLDPARREQLRFTLKTMVEALSPANFPLTNPVVLERTIETRGENLVQGMEHLLADLGKGQLTHADNTAFEVGRNIANTPGKVVLETPMFQLIQYTPTTDNVLETPLLIFPPWINRFYILDLNPQKSFVRWAVEQGISTFIVSWKSADETMAEVTLDDYVRAQIEAIDFIRARLKVPAVHTIGYCVAGTTLAATLAILARRGEADKVASATFFTAQVDFEEAGELKVFVDDHQLAMIAQLGKAGYLDGRYMAATFNLLRSSDLIWSYVINNYLLGEEYPAFDLLHWNSDITNLPAKWHQCYLRDLYRDNLLVKPDALVADGTPIDLSLVRTPVYIQAGREDHIAPPQSVWRMTTHLNGPQTFVLAGSGHIAGVVNPPAAKKYQYWTNPAPVESLEQFVAGATETPGSWWPHWLGWLRELGTTEVPAKGKRVPGSRGDKIIEDAPGRYVATR